VSCTSNPGSADPVISRLLFRVVRWTAPLCRRMDREDFGPPVASAGMRSNCSRIGCGEHRPRFWARARNEEHRQRRDRRTLAPSWSSPFRRVYQTQSARGGSTSPGGHRHDRPLAGAAHTASPPVVLDEPTSYETYDMDVDFASPNCPRQAEGRERTVGRHLPIGWPPHHGGRRFFLPSAGAAVLFGPRRDVREARASPVALSGRGRRRRAQ